MVAARQPITILLSNLSDVSRVDIRRLLEADDRFAIVGEVAADNPVDAAQRLQPDVILVDPAREDAFDLRVVDELYRLVPEVRRVVVTVDRTPTSVIDVLSMRVHGYFLTESIAKGTLLVDALQAIVRAGVVIVDPVIAAR